MLLKVARSNTARHQSGRLERGLRVFACWDGADLVVLTS
jgi:putrescine transport system ATP-binding protein